MITVLTGGTGGAKFVEGLSHVIPPEELTVIVNTADDLEWWGLYVSPDLDSITYALAGVLSRERGWGVQGDTFHCLQTMSQFRQPTWFNIGDRDLALHLVRSRMISHGKTLSEATAEICTSLEVKARVLPMSNSRVETRVVTSIGELTFQEYFVKRWYQDPVTFVRFAGVSDAEAAPGVVDSILAADFVLVAPSNPITSIGPILAVPGIMAALQQTRASIGAVSPIVGGAAVSGPAGTLMQAQGLPCSVMGVAQAYSDFLDCMIIDQADEQHLADLRSAGMKVHSANTIMRTVSDRATLAQEVIKAIAHQAGIPQHRSRFQLRTET